MDFKIRNWDDVSIATYRKIRDLNLDTYLSEAEKGMALLAILCDVDENDVWSLSVGEAQGMLSQISWIKDFKMPDKMKKKFDINGTTYTVELDLNKFSISQYIDFEQYSKGGVTPDKMPEIMSCFLVPKGKTYGKDYSLDDTIKDIDEYMSFPDAQCVCFFFLKSLQTCIEAIKIYSKWTMKRLLRKAPKAERKAKIKEMETAMEAMNQVLFTFH